MVAKAGSSLSGRSFAFEAPLEPWADGMDYAAVAVPSQVTEALGTRGPVLVEARVNESAPFQVSLFPVGGGRHAIRIKAKVRRDAGTQIGDVVRLRFKVLDRANVELPQDLILALKRAGLTAAFAALPLGKQNFLVRRIGEAVKPDTRLKRIQEAAKAASARMEKPG